MKKRVQKGEITAATLTNFVKSLKLYCEMCDISIPWKKITRGLPRPKGVANDRAPSVEEIRSYVKKFINYYLLIQSHVQNANFFIDFVFKLSETIAILKNIKEPY